jgi:RsmE family RNA methyltransferase
VLISNAARVEKSYFETHWLAAEGYTPHLVEGLQQASDTRLPKVTVARSFRKLVEDELDTLCPDTQRLVAHPGAALPLVRTPLTGQRVLLAVGPEGGWNAFELELLGAHGFSTVGMGPRILRTDTACVALLSLVQERLTAHQSAP